MGGRANLTRPLLCLCLAALVITAISARLTKKLAYTGDEPRYLLQALSFALEGVPVMPESRYEQYRAVHQNDFGPAIYPFRDVHHPANETDARKPRHPILTSLLLAPVAATGSLEIIRLLPFAIGLTGLCFLAATLVRQTSGALSAVACFVPAVFGFPSLPYQFLALPEIFLFTLNAIAFWNLCRGSREKIASYTPAIVCSCLAPLVHLRGLALLATTAVYLVYIVRRTSNWRGLRTIGFIFAGTLIFLFISTFYLRDWLGTVNGFPIWKTRVILDMFVHYRHGLLPYAPIWVLSFSGLIAGLYARKPWAPPAAFFLVMFLISSSHAIGEAYPGRFWVQAVPVLALCLSGFTEGVMHTAAKAIVYLPLAVLTFANSVLFVLRPGLHLAARSGAIPYDLLSKIFPAFDFSFWLDVPESSFVRIAAFCFCALVVGLVALGSTMRSKLSECAAALLLVVGFEAHRVRPVAITTAVETNAIVVRVPQSETIAGRAVRLRFQAPWKAVGGRLDESTRPILEVVDGSVRWNTPIRSSSILIHKSASPANDLTVTLRWIDRDPMPIDPAEPGADFGALACNSFFARLW